MEDTRINTTEEWKYMQQVCEQLCFGIYELRCLADNGEQVLRYFIVIKDENGLIWKWTRLAQYADTRTGVVSSITRSNYKKVRYVTQMLNYFFCGPDTSHRIRRFSQITHEKMSDYFEHYAKTPSERTGRYRTQLQVSECILICTQFVDNLLKDGVKLAAKKKELWKKEEKLERQGGQIHSYQKKTTTIPNFHVTCFSEDKQPIFRDIPNQVLQRMFQLAFRYMPHLVMPMALGTFAGLRPGECCQVQQEFVGGFQCQYVAGRLHAVTFDLTRIRQLRSDGICTGSIKRRRKQKVYPGFLEAFQRILQFQKRYLEQVGFEPEFAPLVVNSRGVAMTTAAYSSAFQKLVEVYLRPSLLQDEDPYMQQYGQMLLENKLGPHALRHWFSVALVLDGVNATLLQYYRGDRDIESSYVYVTNKSELVKQYQKTTAGMVDEILKEGVYYAGKELHSAQSGN